MTRSSPLDKPELLEVVRTARALLRRLDQHAAEMGEPLFMDEREPLRTALANLDRINP